MYSELEKPALTYIVNTLKKVKDLGGSGGVIGIDKKGNIRNVREKLKKNNEKKWKEMKRKWKEMKRKWKENEGKWKENEKKWKETEKKWILK